MVEIPLANNRGVTLVDDADAPLLLLYSWHLGGGHKDHTPYAQCTLPHRTLHMHRMLLPGARVVDHIDGDGLNNQRANLRACTHAENMRNTRPYKGKRFKGVYQVRSTGRWRAYITPPGRKQMWLGYFATEEEGAHAYDVAAAHLFGEFARLNFPQQPLGDQLAA